MEAFQQFLRARSGIIASILNLEHALLKYLFLTVYQLLFFLALCFQSSHWQKLCLKYRIWGNLDIFWLGGKLWSWEERFANGVEVLIISWFLVQIHQVAPRSTQCFICLRPLKFVPGTPGVLVLTSKLSACRGSAVLKLNPIRKIGPIKCYKVFLGFVFVQLYLYQDSTVIGASNQFWSDVLKQH